MMKTTALAATDLPPAPMIAGAIPLVDVAGHLAGDGDASRRTAAQLRWAFENVGFYYLAGQGDSGDTWTHLESGLYDPDIHAVTIAATQPKRLYASTAREVFTSSNLGETWQPLGIKEKWPLPYARGIMQAALR
jgi:hypothetical protein